MSRKQINLVSAGVKKMGVLRVGVSFVLVKQRPELRKELKYFSIGPGSFTNKAEYKTVQEA